MGNSETLRAALRAAEASILNAASETDHETQVDRRARSDFDLAHALVREWREKLEGGDWYDREVEAYPIQVERILDGS